MAVGLADVLRREFVRVGGDLDEDQAFGARADEMLETSVVGTAHARVVR